MKETIVICAAVVTVVTMLIAYSLYTNAEARKLYAECLRVTEQVVKTGPSYASLPFCRL